MPSHNRRLGRGTAGEVEAAPATAPPGSAAARSAAEAAATTTATGGLVVADRTAVDAIETLLEGVLHIIYRHAVGKVDTIDDVEMASVAAELEVQLVDVQGANTVRETRTLWIFECQPDVDQVPAATVRIGDTLTEISLPTSPGGVPTPNLCAVRVEDSTTGPSATAWISPERSLANALQNMLASGKVLHAAHMADQATELLHDKYSDPTGATLGALILHKVGRLNRLQSWVENLVNDFGWIPDAKVLLAVMLLDDRSDLQGALDLATEASQQRMLFTECYSILLDLLRRWPKKYEWELRQPSLMALTERSSYIDWESICLTIRQEDDDA